MIEYCFLLSIHSLSLLLGPALPLFRVSRLLFPKHPMKAFFVENFCSVTFHCSVGFVVTFGLIRLIVLIRICHVSPSPRPLQKTDVQTYHQGEWMVIIWHMIRAGTVSHNFTLFLDLNKITFSCLTQRSTVLSVFLLAYCLTVKHWA